VITQENSSFATMDTSQVLDLFSVENKKDKKTTANKPASSKTSMSDVLENLGELWEQEQYEQEYDLNSFMNKLAS
jgi:TATA-binding protein-associated factor